LIRLLCQALRHGGQRNFTSVCQSEIGTAPARIDPWGKLFVNRCASAALKSGKTL
jgi:hypothetical protein